MRGEVINKGQRAARRFESDFENLPPEALFAGVYASRKPAHGARRLRDHDIALLCLLAYATRTPADFCADRTGERSWRKPSELGDSGPKILESDLRQSDAASLSAFIARLPQAEESIVSAWLLQKCRARHPSMENGGWGFASRFAASAGSGESRMKLPQLSTGEVVNLQKQILDLTEQLHELSQFSPGPSVTANWSICGRRILDVPVNPLTAQFWPGIRNRRNAQPNARPGAGRSQAGPSRRGRKCRQKSPPAARESESKRNG